MINSCELKRQSFHVFFITFFAIMIYNGLMNLLHFIVILAAGFILSLVYRRTEIPGIRWFMNHFERPKYIKAFPGRGALSAVLGVAIVLALFGNFPHIVAGSLMVLGLGDSIATVIGQRGGPKHPLNPRKSLFASIAGTTAGFVGALLVPGVTVLAAALAAIVGMTVEAVNIRAKVKFDDNITVPLASSIVLYLVLVL